MAVSAREVILVFRGQNYLSSAIRKVGRDVGSLSRTAQLTQQRGQLQINQQRMTSARNAARVELQSIQTGGTRRLALEKRIAEAKISQLSITQQQAKLEDSINARQTQQLNAQARASRLTRLVGAGRPLRGFNLAETRTMQQAANQQLEDLTAQQATAMRQREVLVQRLATQTLTTEQLTAAEAQLAEREAQLTQIINTRSRAIELNNLKLKQNALLMSMLPVERVRDYARNIEHAGRVLQMFGLIATAAFGYAAESAAKFETAGTLAATQMITRTNNSVAQIHKTGAALNKELLDFLASGKSVLSAQEAQQAAYAIPSGIPSLRGDSLNKARQTVAIIKELNTVIKANFGLVTSDQASSAAIILVNTFNTAVKDLPHAFDIIQSAVNRGKVTLGEFISGLSQTAPAAKGAGYNLSSMASTLSFLSGKLPQYTRVATGYARALELFQNPKLQQFMKANGAAITDASGRLLGYNKIIAQLLKVFPDLATKHGNLIADLTKAAGTKGFVQARRVLTPSLQDLAGLNKAMHDVPANAEGLVNASATALSKTGAVKWRELTTQIKALIIVIGQGAVPVFQDLAKPVEYLLKQFNSLSPSTRKLVGEFGAWIAVGTLLIGTFLAIGGGIASLIANMILITKTWRESRIAASLLADETGSIMVGGLLGLGAIIAIPVLIRYHKQVMDVINALGGLKNVLVALAAFIVALKFAPMITTMMGVATEANTAAAEVGGLRLALLSLAGPEVLLALGALAAALVALDLFSNRKASALQTITDKTSVNTRVVANRAGQLFRQNVTSERGSHRMTQLTPAQARALGGNVNMPHNAIEQAIKDSPRYQHAMRANQAAVDAFDKSLEKLNVTHKLDKALGVTKEARSVELTVPQIIAHLEKLQAARLASPNDLSKARAYEKAQIDLNNRFKNTPALLAAINDVLSNYDSNLKSATSSTNTLGVTTQDVLQSLQSMYQQFSQQEAGIFGTLFNGPLMNSPAQQDRFQFGGRVTGRDVLNDLKSQIRQFTTFHSMLDTLRRRGASQALISQLAQAGPAAKDDIKALTQLSPRDFQDYLREFNRGQKMIQDQSIRDLRQQLNVYRQHGRNIALAIVAGLRDENVAVTNALTKMIAQMFPGLPTGATGAGGHPTHHRQPQAPVIHNHIHVPAHEDNKPPISKRAQQRHVELKTKNRYSTPFGGPR